MAMKRFKLMNIKKQTKNLTSWAICQVEKLTWLDGKVLKINVKRPHDENNAKLFKYCP